MGRDHDPARTPDAGVPGGLAEFERDLIRARGEGLPRAVANGVKLGRKPKLTPQQQHEARQRVADGNETLREIARSYNVHNSTISRLAAHPLTHV
jgi:DNA invertase Pin-like site-specific DNA recombinase